MLTTHGSSHRASFRYVCPSAFQLPCSSFPAPGQNQPLIQATCSRVPSNAKTSTWVAPKKHFSIRIPGLYKLKSFWSLHYAVFTLLICVCRIIQWAVSDTWAASYCPLSAKKSLTSILKSLEETASFLCLHVLTWLPGFSPPYSTFLNPPHSLHCEHHCSGGKWA